MLTRVFDLFAQAPASLGLAKGGLGIGLTLARTLIELHGGRVGAESKGLGKGTTIAIRLPLAAAPRAQPPQSQRLAVARERTPSINVLVVDDNQDAANATAQLLRESGSNVLVAYTGADALELAERTDFDLALLDIGLPDMTGYALAEQLRRFSGERTHVLAISGYGTREAARRASESGFDGYLVKPVTAKALETITREIAEGSTRRERVQHAAVTARVNR
jgi:CheY-like chemotaxis protein